MLTNGAERVLRPSTYLDLTPAEISTYYRLRTPKVRQEKGKEWRGPCPIHQGTHDSFASTETWAYGCAIQNADTADRSMTWKWNCPGGISEQHPLR